MPSPRLLLLSSSRTAGSGPLEHARSYLADFLQPRPRALLFVPFARVSGDYEGYVNEIRPVFAALGCEIYGLHTRDNPVHAIAEAEALAVGGGNTFQLLRVLCEQGLLEPLRQRALAGAPYIGWSAGSNLACPTIRTTNDMPIAWPPQCIALNLVPFQINPHYTDAHPPGHQGETRAERLKEFVALNPDLPVVALREGSGLRVDGDKVQLLGEHTARIFTAAGGRDVAPQEPWPLAMKMA